jgi:hypothetical protein
LNILADGNLVRDPSFLPFFDIWSMQFMKIEFSELLQFLDLKKSALLYPVVTRTLGATERLPLGKSDYSFKKKRVGRKQRRQRAQQDPDERLSFPVETDKEI